MSTFEELKVKSSIHDYSARFVDDFSQSLQEDRAGKSFVLIDQSVLQLYKEKLQDALKDGQYLAIEANELQKTYDSIGTILTILIRNDIKRGDTLIAIGGGVIQDITGFIASVLFRGMRWVLYPTTLLAQADSCIGSKTSINVGEFKNQIGTFYPPDQVIVDLNFLKTLSPSDVKSGLGEIIKVHLMDGEASLDYILTHYTQDTSNLTAFRDLILRSLQIKKAIIEKDEFDKDYRNILNYGHSFGHAIEATTDYAVPHGQAVTLGMDIANYTSLKLGMLEEKTYEHMKAALEKNLPDFHLEEKNVDLLLQALAKDKKNVDQNLTVILTKGPGEMLKMKLPATQLREFLHDFRSRPA